MSLTFSLTRRRGLALLLLAAACQASPSATLSPTPEAPTTAGPPSTVVAEATHTHSLPTPTAVAAATEPPPATLVMPPNSDVVDWPGAVSINVVAGAGPTVYVLTGRGQDLSLYRSDDAGKSFGAAVVVSQGTHAEVLAVVRPALAMRADGRLCAAWVELLSGGQSRVRASFSDDGGDTFSEPATLATTSDPETTMASVTFDPAGNPLVFWLQNSTLQFAASADGGASFADPLRVDDLVCECCQPHPLALEGAVWVAYRNLVRQPSGPSRRDIHVAVSHDGGATFAEPVPVSDGAWLIDACPIAGPALAAHAGTLYTAWMDGRHDDGMFAHTDIWVAASTDGGASFGANTRVNSAEGGYNGQPVMVVDAAGRLHVAWDADADGGTAIHYAYSDDGGRTFSPAQVVAAGASGAGRGRLRQAALAVGAEGQVYAAWSDALGVHLTML